MVRGKDTEIIVLKIVKFIGGKKIMQIGDIVTLSVATPITRVIFDYNRNCTCVRVRTKYNSFTDEKVMPLKKGCTVWICSKNKKSGGFDSFKLSV